MTTMSAEEFFSHTRRTNDGAMVLGSSINRYTVQDELGASNGAGRNGRAGR